MTQTLSLQALLSLPVLSYRIRFPSLAYLGVCYRTERENRSKGSSKPAQPLHGHIPFSDAFHVVACALRYPDPVLSASFTSKKAKLKEKRMVKDLQDWRAEGKSNKIKDCPLLPTMEGLHDREWG